MWAPPVRSAFQVPSHYKLLMGVSLGFASEHVVNTYNPGRAPLQDVMLPNR